MTSRRDFLRKTSLALAGGLVVGDAAMEMYERMTHRKVWAMGADFSNQQSYSVWYRLVTEESGGFGPDVRWQYSVDGLVFQNIEPLQRVLPFVPLGATDVYVTTRNPFVRWGTNA